MNGITADKVASPKHPIGTAIFGLLLVILGTAILYFSKDIRAFALGESDPGPKALPICCAIFFLLGGLIQIALAIFLEGLFKHKPASLNVLPMQFWGTIGLFLGYVMTLNLLGYIIATSLFMLSLLLVFRSPWLEAIISTVVLVCFVYALFEVIFKVSLPSGIIY